ncbi:MAG: DNA-binding MarR family transcriptional regulator [Aureispira sp.]|jgi:DNA-binding MarR family transcriptional regulator
MRIEEEIKQTKPFPNPQTKAVVNLNFTASWLSCVQAEMLKPYGISIQQYNILRILRGMHPKPATVKTLIDRMIDKNSNASRLVDKLLKKGLLERNTCPRDRRRVDVMITEVGLDMVSEVSKAMKKNKEFMNLTDEDAVVLSDLLDKLRSTY